MFSSFFLGSNSGGGFHSFYKELIDTKEAEAVYILKGGPGSGKSSLMRRVGKCAEEKGLPVERIFCSSDPDSLDAVILPTLKKAVVDGTAPHITEPDFPLAVEQYINLGQFADIEEIKKKKREIIETKEKYSSSFKDIYRTLACAEKIDDELFDIALGAYGVEYLKKRARGIISREIKKNGSGASFRRRFCDAISPKGLYSLLQNSDETAERIYIIDDSYGLSHFILSQIKEACLTSEYSCTACFSPLKPTQMLHLLIPELSLAFLTSSRDVPLDFEYHRKIRLDSKTEGALDAETRAKVRKLRRLRKSFITDASQALLSAKLVHDELENLYNPHIDFDALYTFADGLCREIFE